MALTPFPTPTPDASARNLGGALSPNALASGAAAPDTAAATAQTPANAGALARGLDARPVNEPGLSWSEQGQVIKRVMPLLWPDNEPGLKTRTAVALIAILLAKIVNVVVPILYKNVIDALTPSGANAVSVSAVVAVPVMLIVGYGVLRLVSLTITEFRDLIFAPVQERALRIVSVNVLRHLHELSLRFHLERQMGGLSRAIERGTDGMDTLISYLIFNIAPIFLELFLVAGVLWHYFDLPIAAVTFVVVILYAGYTAAATTWRMKYRREMNMQDREANTRAVDSLLNYETVKYFGNEGLEIARFDEAKQDYVTAAIANQRALTTFNAGQSVILSSGVVLVMLMAAYSYAQHRMTMGDFVMVNAYLLQLYQPLNMLGWVYRSLRQSMTDIERMYALLEEKPDVADAPDAKPLREGPGHVRFENVRFSYDPRRSILKGVSFEIPAGKTMAVVGPTGSGKTTLARLLFRFYDPQSGDIFIDGQNIKHVTQQSLRGAMGVVPQDTVLFNDSLFYNIADGRPEAGAGEVAEAAKRARLDELIEKIPDGFATRVGERGLKLSGGEKQRVAIARVILKRPEILIFDEATSSLDSHTEAEIQASLRQVSTHRTTLVIAHRLSTVVDADEILVLDEGEIVERGDHATLLARGGTYAALWERQQKSASLAEVAE